MTNKTVAQTPKSPVLVQVKSITDITPQLRRITFCSPALRDYPAECPAAHVKIFLPRDGQLRPDLPTFGEKGPIWPENAIKPLLRTYTVRYVRPEAEEIDIEFILHGDNGPAAQFAQNAQAGEFIGVSYPAKTSPIGQYRHCYLVGDNTALPAIASLLESLPKQTGGHVFILLNRETDKLQFAKPDNVQIHWFIGDVQSKTDELIAEFKTLLLPENDVYFWLAGENNLVVELRNYLRREREYNKEFIYAIPYWRRGESEEQYNRRRHEVMDEE